MCHMIHKTQHFTLFNFSENIFSSVFFLWRGLFIHLSNVRLLRAYYGLACLTNLSHKLEGVYFCPDFSNSLCELQLKP